MQFFCNPGKQSPLWKRQQHLLRITSYLNHCNKISTGCKDNCSYDRHCIANICTCYISQYQVQSLIYKNCHNCHNSGRGYRQPHGLLPFQPKIQIFFNKIIINQYNNNRIKCCGKNQGINPQLCSSNQRNQQKNMQHQRRC